ncbi:Prephenate dehydrogenase [Thermocrinis albus DSM 14484]|uniref:prephenate dehydrogenase n=1 Tax=Thermocrinis albus (strain DSM 14484 / JCM 11386 / HI 11/12) TaxID=638303 RepID=D3SLX3_THEAH|nr:prephenate dehydrogenase/arogenate dehydrogenase family protein [Thermocrinis albus]ADC89753.1 Prephenate dehydrogenase [Thermocrinis albus DSM 14484]
MFERVAIIGFGFMGGSLAMAIRDVYSCRIMGIDRSHQALQTAKKMGLLEEGSTQIEDIASFDPQLVVLATPVRAYYEIAPRLVHVVSPQCVITDIGSVKGRLVFFLEDVLGPRFVGGHPIAGTEKSGVENSVRGLFKDKKVVITPTPNTSQESLRWVEQLWKGIGSHVEFMDPYLHDLIFGAVSHLPHAVAFALVKAVLRMSQEEKVDMLLYAGAGFKDFTRIAASDPTMWRDIFTENKEYLLKALTVFKDSLEDLRKMIEEEKWEDLFLYLQEAREGRLRLY